MALCRKGMPDGSDVVEEMALRDENRDRLEQASPILPGWPVSLPGVRQGRPDRLMLNVSRPPPHPNPNGLGHGLLRPQLPEPKPPVSTENG